MFYVKLATFLTLPSALQNIKASLMERTLRPQFQTLRRNAFYDVNFKRETRINYFSG